MSNEAISTWVPDHNPDKSCGGGFKYAQLVGKPFSFFVTVFKNRIYEWYFRPIQSLAAVKDPSRSTGFLMTMVSCVVIDILSQYTNGQIKHRKNDYIEFVRKLDPLFAEPLSPPIISISFEKTNKNNIQTEAIMDLAQAFYHGFRSGIIHGGKILDYGRISGKEKAPKIVQILEWDGKREIAVNPEALFDKVLENYNHYIDNLFSAGNKDLNGKFLKNSFGTLELKVRAQ